MKFLTFAPMAEPNTPRIGAISGDYVVDLVVENGDALAPGGARSESVQVRFSVVAFYILLRRVS